MEPMLKVKDLAVTLDGHEIFKNVSFELKDGESLAIIGPNGSGKTVLLKALLGSLPHSGTIEWRKDIRTGYVPQKIEADRRLPITIKDLLEAKAKLLKSSAKELKHSIEHVGLTPTMLKKPIGLLSGGQFQRALISFAFLGNPNVVLFDEPTASIDEPGEELIYELIHRLQDEHGVSVILVSHDLSFVYRYANKVLCLSRAGICFGEPEDVLTPENLKKLFDGHTFYHHLHPHEETNLKT